ncbi:MAG: transglutaminase-like cysteine peptidase [Rhodospirillaceae bacterium]|nr:transglutaminase-like cysteine peptidase [Rhodospirillaceae bacterium]
MAAVDPGLGRLGRATPPPCRLVSAVLAVAMLAALPAAARAQGLFGSIEFSSNSLSAIPQWLAVIDRIRSERATLASCDANAASCPTERVRAWRSLVESARGYSQTDQLAYVNQFANAVVPYITDSDNYGVSDYWAAPLEFLRRSGDCEDYAIIKFVSLLDLGFTNDQMRIVIVRDIVRNLAHAVLAVEMNGRFYILDSLFNAVLEDARVSQYVPQYSVNLDTRWAHIMR